MTNPFLWGTLILYVAILGYSIMHHELWGDELHSWNIAKASRSFSDLISNTRYEGHPPVWYTILWLISKFTHNLVYVQLVHGTMAAAIVFVLLFYSPLPIITKVLMPFGYYFMYEYAVINRNYAIGVLILLCICLTLHKNFKYKILVYYFLLFLLSNTHLIALLLAASVHVYFLFLQIENKKGKFGIAWHVVIGASIFLTAASFIFPPADSELNVQFWINRWSFDQIKAIVHIILRAYLPIPAWWNENFWNTEFLLEARNDYSALKFINLLIALLLVVTSIFILRKNKNALILFATNTVLTFIIVVTIFPLGTARYSGFIFIGFVVAYWLNCYGKSKPVSHSLLLNTILVFQIIGGFFAVVKDAGHPFSNAFRIQELLKEVPKNEKAVTDYWALNIISAYADEPFYCVDLQKEKSFILWNKDLSDSRKVPNCYYYGASKLFQRERISNLYFITTLSPENLLKVDPKLMSSFSVTLVDKRDGAIISGSNLYLYKISVL